MASLVGGSDREADSDVVQILIVRLADVRCGLVLETVVEVLPAAKVDRLPGAPASVRGVLNLRGELIGVLDGRKCLGFEDRELRPSDRFVVIRVGDHDRVLRVDTADDLIALPRDQVVAAMSVAPEALVSAGIARLPDGVLVIHDPAAFLSAADDAALRQALLDLAAVKSS